MGFIDKYPYTDFHELNLDWLISKTQDNVTSIETINDNITAINNEIENMSADISKNTNDINALRDAISDHSGWVTPEMYGAIGNGVDDDSDAWDAAVASGYNIICASKQYRCDHAIVIDRDIEIDCNGASFTVGNVPVDDPDTDLVNSNTLFYFIGNMDESSISLENDYSANQGGYTISNSAYSTYSGMGKILGTNIYTTDYQNFYTGFIAQFANGKMADRFPVGITVPVLYRIMPITVKIKNISGITHDKVNTSAKSIILAHCENSIVENICGSFNTQYFLIEFVESYQCYVDKSKIVFSSTLSNSYPISIFNSSYSTVKNCYIYNASWHCISTAESALNPCCVWRTNVENCILWSEANPCYADHSNAIGTTIINCVGSELYVTAMAYIDNYTMFETTGSVKHLMIDVMLSEHEETAFWTIKNIKFMTYTATSSSNTAYRGIRFRNERITRYVRRMTIENVYAYNDGNTAMTYHFSNTTTPVDIEEVYIDNTNLSLQLTPPTDSVISKFWVDLNNMCSKLTASSQAASIGGKYTTLAIRNSRFRYFIAGFTCTNLTLDNIICHQVPSSDLVSGCVTKLYGSKIRYDLGDTFLSKVTNGHITDMVRSTYGNIFNIQIISGVPSYQFWHLVEGIYKVESTASA